MKPQVLDLFSGIGGFALAGDWAGMETVAFCEQNEFCQKVLAKHWPNVPIFDDVRTLNGNTLRQRGIGRVDVITGGFPCQDVSLAGLGAGLAEGTRSGLWTEYARLIGELRPSFVVVENVTGLLQRGAARVLGDLSRIGYDAEWRTLRASDIGAHHERARVFIVAYPDAQRRGTRLGNIFDRAQAILCEGARERAQFWLQAPCVRGGMDDGVSGWTYRNRVGALGNSIVPQVAYPILKAIAEMMNAE